MFFLHLYLDVILFYYTFGQQKDKKLNVAV